MKTNIVIALVVLSTFILGCKNEKSIDDLEVVTPVALDNNFKVTIKVIAKVQDDFALYFTEDGSINFFDVKPIWQGVKASDSEQDVTFTLPDGVYPTQLRFDLGLKKNQEDIIIKGAKLSYKGKNFETSGPDFFNYFRADENQCTADISSGTIKAVVKDGVRKGPSLYPIQDILGKKLLELSK